MHSRFKVLQVWFPSTRSFWCIVSSHRAWNCVAMPIMPRPFCLVNTLAQILWEIRQLLWYKLRLEVCFFPMVIRTIKKEKDNLPYQRQNVVGFFCIRWWSEDGRHHQIRKKRWQWQEDRLPSQALWWGRKTTSSHQSHHIVEMLDNPPVTTAILQSLLSTSKILRLLRKMTLIIDSLHIWSVIYNARSKQESPSNFTKYCPCHEKWLS